MSEEERSNLLDMVRARLWLDNQSWNAAFLGSPGTGKSWSALSVAEYIDKNFSINKVFFTIKDFVTAMAEGRLKKGSAVMLDEIGVSWGSRAAMSINNKQMSYLTQIMRFKNIATLMTLPSLSMLDVHGRDLMNAVLETYRINKKERYCTVKYKTCHFNPTLAKVYRKKPRIMYADGRIVTVKYMRIYSPSMKLIRDYEKAKRIYANKLIDEIKNKLESDDDKDGKTDNDIETNAACMKCGHEWVYSGSLEKPTCPSCKSSRTTTTT